METLWIDFPYAGIAPVEVPEQNLLGVYKPRTVKLRYSPLEIVERGFSQPIGSPRLCDLARGCSRVLVLCDDNTRPTPVKLMLPPILEQLAKAGVGKDEISILVAGGTHRLMSEDEIIGRFGQQVVDNYHVFCHQWQNESELSCMGTTEHGTEIWVNRHALEADLVIGVGHIVPHGIVGFSGGAKIVQPGICGEKTTGQTHWLAAHYPIDQLLGVRDNPVRAEIDEVGVRVGLKFIANAIQDGSGHLVHVVTGNPIDAHRRGCEVSASVYGVSTPGEVDIVMVDSYPNDLVQWQAINGIFPAGLVVRRGGHIILVSPCPEGVDPQHPEVLQYGYRSFAEIRALVESGMITNLTAASQLARVGRITAEKARLILVSTGLDEATTRRLGFEYAPTVQDALTLAFREQGRDAKVAVLRNGSEILPVVSERMKEEGS